MTDEFRDLRIIHNGNAAHRLLQIIGSHGWTQQEVARRIGLPASVISEHLSGQRRIQAQHLTAYVTLLDAQEKTLLLGAWLRDNVQTEFFWIAIADELPITVWATDDAGNTVFINNHWLALTGRSFQDVLGRENWTNALHPDDAKAAHENFMRQFEKREPVTEQYRVKRYDGVYRFMHGRGVPRVDALGKFIGYIGFALDITDLLLTK
jgi:PAS domain S-box-containing protein